MLSIPINHIRFSESFHWNGDPYFLQEWLIGPVTYRRMTLYTYADPKVPLPPYFGKPFFAVLFFLRMHAILQYSQRTKVWRVFYGQINLWTVSSGILTKVSVGSRLRGTQPKYILTWVSCNPHNAIILFFAVLFSKSFGSAFKFVSQFFFRRGIIYYNQKAERIIDGKHIFLTVHASKPRLGNIDF